MPELPEVETTRRGLEPRVKGRVIERAELRLPKLLQGCPAAGLDRALAGRRILAVGRRAKHLLIRLSGGLTLGVHLGMSGQLTFWDHRRRDAGGFLRHYRTGLQKTPTQHAPDKHTHLLLHLKGGDRVQYRDPRQFGRLRLYHGDPLRQPPLAGLGPEPLDPALTARAFGERLAARRGMLKALLLNQAFVAGIGNIYADEALFCARLHPRRRAETLGPAERARLFACVRKVLRQGIAQGGTSFSDFIGADGARGGNQERLLAYGRGGEPCLRCGAALARTLVGQRSTVFCPHCQRRRG
jgi:formamidopyrimidine-DNA glycosylase